jgi:DNA-binding transcriptional regulator GbsR (MarR family)
MHKNLLKAQEHFVQHVNNVCNLFEKDGEKGRLMATFYISEKPLSKRELGDKLKISLEKIDELLGKGLDKGIIKEVKVKGSEEISYEISHDVVDVVMSRMKIKIKEKVDMSLKAIGECQKSLEECEEELDYSERVVAKLLYERLERLRRMNEIGRRILKGILLHDVLDVDTGQLKKVDIK